MVTDWHLEKRRIHHFHFCFVGDFPAEYSLMLEMRSQQDTHKTQIKYDIKVTQDFVPQKQKPSKDIPEQTDPAGTSQAIKDFIRQKML